MNPYNGDNLPWEWLVNSAKESPKGAWGQAVRSNKDSGLRNRWYTRMHLTMVTVASEGWDLKRGMQINEPDLEAEWMVEKRSRSLA